MYEEQKIPTFFHDVEDTKTAVNLAAQLVPHAQIAFESPAPAPAWAEPEYKGRLGYIKNALDRAFPPFLQDIFIASTGADWIVRELQTGHSPFLSKPAELAALVQEYDEIFRKV